MRRKSVVKFPLTWYNNGELLLPVGANSEVVMKKKSVKILLAALLSCLMAMALCACSLFSWGYKADSNYPFDIAKESGFTGTEAEWASEQKSPSTLYRRLYEEAVADGYTGSYFEFRTALNLSAMDATPYVQRAMLSVVSIVCTFGVGSEGAAGSGVIINLNKTTGDAYILTNYHVVYSKTGRVKISNDIHVYLYGYENATSVMSAQYVGGVMEQDIAVLKITNSALLRESAALAATVADSAGVMAGQPVYAIGNAMNDDIAVNAGVVSMETEYIYMEALNGSGYMNLACIRFDGTVNHGNSGGGLFNAMGELVGIVNGRDERDGVTGFNYAIPTKIALSIAENIMDNGGARVADFGLDLTFGDTKAVYDETPGVVHYLEKIVVEHRSGAAASAGVRPGDTLISAAIVRGGVEQKTVQFLRYPDFLGFTFTVRMGDSVKFTVSRDGAAVELIYSFTQSGEFESFA